MNLNLPFSRKLCYNPCFTVLMSKDPCTAHKYGLCRDFLYVMLCGLSFIL